MPSVGSPAATRRANPVQAPAIAPAELVQRTKSAQTNCGKRIT